MNALLGGWRIRLLKLLSAAGVAGAASVPGAAQTAPSWPPTIYKLADARIVVKWIAVTGQPSQKLMIKGNGKGTLARQGRQSAFIFDPSTTLSAINSLYRMRFFDMASQQLPERSLIVGPDGTARLRSALMHDAVTTKLCFTLPKYEKCVSYRESAPRELLEFVRDIRTRAEAAAKPVR